MTAKRTRKTAQASKPAPLKLGKRRPAEWIELGGPVRALCRPAGQFELDLAGSRAGAKAKELVAAGATLDAYGLSQSARDVFGSDGDVQMGTSKLLVAVELGLIVIEELDGVDPNEVTRENLALLMGEWTPDGHGSFAQVFLGSMIGRSTLEREEGNGSAV